ncbi:MAG: GWxTD domain-containing protein [Balneolaceae bacterium]|nr:GWxTD domain-containing protein [Balneolaceae bacterium]
MVLSSNRILLLLALTCFSFAGTALFAQPQRAYERGLDELYRGNTTNALDIWYTAYDRNGGVDGRIGFEFIRVVTENELRSYYEAATEMYLRAISNGEGMDSRAALRQEIDRMSPIIGEGIHRQWMEWWTGRDRELIRDMRGYWVQKDPTPAKVTNERLIEHWKRIAYSRKHFTRNNNTVYGTDDRALIHIRYGEPERKRSGILTLQSFNIRSWLENQAHNYTQRSDDLEYRDIFPREDEDIINRLQNAIYEFHRYPEYEIWFYTQLSESQSEPLIFLFGTDVRTDQFLMQTSLEDFIPERAYHPDRVRQSDSIEFTRAGITPALMLQLIYYEQLTMVDPFFENRLNELRTRVLDQGIEAFRGMDLAFRTESQQLVSQRGIRIDRETSTYEQSITRIPLEVHQYRFLDDDLQPYLLTYVESSPREALMIDYHRTRGRSFENNGFQNGVNILEENPLYELVHNIQTYDEYWRVAEMLEDFPQINISSANSYQLSESVFKIPHTNRANQSISVLLMNYDPDAATINNTPFPAELRGWNRLQYRLPEPLISHPDSLEVADLVLGYHDENYVSEPFSFAVANNQIVPFGEILLLHFEVYNLRRMENQFTQFELTYRILPVDDDGNVLTDQTEFILTLNFTNEERHVIEDLEIETANLSPGLYELVAQFSDTESKQSKQRNIRFEVVD